MASHAAVIQPIGERDLVIRVNMRFNTRASNKLRQRRRDIRMHLHFRDTENTVLTMSSLFITNCGLEFQLI